MGEKLTYGPRYIVVNVSWVIFGVPMLKTFRTVSPVLVVCGVGGTENRTAVLKKHVLTRRSGGGGGAVPSSCDVVGGWCVVLVMVAVLRRRRRRFRSVPIT
jgi:MYXO-CTERM domain-containing protein